MSFNFDVATANIKNSLSRAQVQSDVDKLVAIADIIGFQEIRGFDHNDVVNSISGWSKFGTFAPEEGRYVPIAWKDSVWTLVNSGFDQIWEGDSLKPPRYLNWVRLQRVATGDVIRVVNTHFTAGMDWEDPTPEPDEQAARVGWNSCWNGVNDRIDTWMDGGYTPIVLTGDFNKKQGDIAKFASAQVFATTGGIDQISYISGAHFDTVKEVTDLNGDVTNDRFNTDHGPKIWRLKKL